MNIRNRVAVTIAAATAEASPCTSWELLIRGGLHRKALLAGRVGACAIGSFINRGIVDAISDGVPGLGELRVRPVAHGWGSVVYIASGSPDSPGKCIKVINPRVGVSGHQAAEECAADIDSHVRYLGSRVADTKVHTIDSPFVRAQQLVVVEQERVIGTPLLPGSAAADPDSLVQFGAQVREMLTATGCLPDIGGPGNILVEPDGCLKLVDVGTPISHDRKDFDMNFALLCGLESGVLSDRIAA